MKKFISIVLSVIMLMSAVITVNAASFKDVKSSDWYYSSVSYVADKGIMQGTSSTKFEPGTSLSRAMGVTLIHRLAGTPSASGMSIPFKDVKGGQWYTDAVKWAYSKGIVNGKSNTEFATNANITRAEFATILNRFSNYMGYTLPNHRTASFTDSWSIPSWAASAVNTMYGAGIINGKDDGSFDPYANISRAEAAALIERFAKTTGILDTPLENPDIPTTGQIVVKEKKYAYGDVDVMILTVENQSDTNINVTFIGKFMDSKGNVVATKIEQVKGFPANYRNYVIFEPEVKFSKFTYETKITQYSGEAYMKYIVFGSEVDYTVKKMTHSDLLGLHEQYPAGQERLGFYITFRYDNTSDKNGSEKVKLNVPCKMAFIGSDGVLYSILHYKGAFDTYDASQYKNQCPVAEHILYKNWKQPSNFKLSLLPGLTNVIPLQ